MKLPGGFNLKSSDLKHLFGNNKCQTNNKLKRLITMF
jgi:hypothetical protein